MPFLMFQLTMIALFSLAALILKAAMFFLRLIWREFAVGVFASRQFVHHWRALAQEKRRQKLEEKEMSAFNRPRDWKKPGDE